ncbi:hypothetical protein RND81_10G065600 [Saponaria officinalis]|uniref:Protein kinase domain-containing protein n=1 Tax=Saponaria officinalis TaxID=3572 RepID=A0AAW1I146_SAPOF
MSPKLVAGGEASPAVDVWAVVCAVAEMLSGKSVWEVSPECDVGGLFVGLVWGESPKVDVFEVGKLGQVDIFLDGKDFISKCFIKDSSKRWTAEMLLDHPFVSGVGDLEKDELSVSPRDPFEFFRLEYCGRSCLDQVGFSGMEFGEHSSLDPFGVESGFEFSEEYWSSGCDRVLEMACDVVPDWLNSDGWIDVR